MPHILISALGNTEQGLVWWLGPHRVSDTKEPSSRAKLGRKVIKKDTANPNPYP